MTMRNVSASIVLCSYLTTMLLSSASANAESAKSEGDLSPAATKVATPAASSSSKSSEKGPGSATGKGEAANSYEPDTLAQLNHEAMKAFKEHKNDVAQHLMEKVVAGLEQEKESELSQAEALENLHLILAAASSTQEADETLAKAKAIRASLHLPPADPKVVDILPTHALRKQATEKAKEVKEIVEGHDPLFPADKFTEKEKSAEYWSTLMMTAKHEREIGEHRKSIYNYRKALAIAYATPKATDKVVASMNMLASLYRMGDKPSTARILYLECIQLHEKMGKTEGADYATLLDNAGQTLVVLHEYSAAEKTLESAVQIFKKASGAENADTAMAMCNLGEVYLMLKQDEKGEATIADALAIFRRVLKPEDMRVLITADNLAEIYSKHGKLKEAEELQRSVIATMEKVVGKGVHPDLCLALNNLAQTLFKEKKYNEADPLLKRCIDMNKAIYGEKHPKTVLAMRSYATFLEKTGKTEQADKIMKDLTAPPPPPSTTSSAASPTK